MECICRRRRTNMLPSVTQVCNHNCYTCIKMMSLLVLIFPLIFPCLAFCNDVDICAISIRLKFIPLLSQSLYIFQTVVEREIKLIWYICPGFWNLIPSSKDLSCCSLDTVDKKFSLILFKRRRQMRYVDTLSKIKPAL